MTMRIALQKECYFCNDKDKQLTAANKRIERQNNELLRVAEFALCMGSPVEYEDDTIYLQGIKAAYAFANRQNDKKEEEIARLKEEANWDNRFTAIHEINRTLQDKITKLEETLARTREDNIQWAKMAGQAQAQVEALDVKIAELEADNAELKEANHVFRIYNKAQDSVVAKEAIRNTAIRCADIAYDSDSEIMAYDNIKKEFLE
jgi:chromosome segregation ATPase